ncbi:MAG: hypothetical protein ICV51_16980 [Flavisolibacter sp.]|nr:hypothetical protein [Flavisolibacter sp.]MBD0353357.1 hypothetical protein [Flavisolibacter sp.]MBD0377310.1 hypothetical protein [Flavisolibacter sp.]
MVSEQNTALQPEGTDRDNNNAAASEDKKTSEGHNTEIATNDGSVTETLDTAFHGTPGWSEGENLSGSNRADYYESRSYGKTDVEEELEARRKEQSE